MSRSTRLRFPSQKAKENMETEAIVTFWRIVKKTHIQKSTDDIEQLKLLIEQVDTAYDAVVSSSTVVEEDISNAAKVLVDSIQEKIESLQENKSIRASSIHGCTSQVSYRSHYTDMKRKQSGIRLMDAVWNSSSTCGTRRTINKSLQSLPLFYEDKPRHLMHEPPMARSASQGALLAPHDSTLGDGTHIQKHVISPSRSRHSHMSTSRRHDTKENVDELRRKLEDLQRIQAEKEHERQERAKQERLQNQDLQRQTDALQQQINFATSNTEYSTSTYRKQPHHTDLAQLAEILSDNMTMNRLPLPEPTIFNGDPLSYLQWKTSFDILIGQRNVNAAEKIFFLQKYTGGAAKRCIEGAFYLASEEAYVSARKKLEQRFGADDAVADAFRSKLSEVKRISNKDYSALQEYADLLSQTSMARECIYGLEILDDKLENQKLAKKLPDPILHRWAHKLLFYVEKGRYPLFNEFVTFVNNESEACNNPLIANLFDRPVVTSTTTSGKKCFATSVEERTDSSPIQRFTDFDGAKKEKEKWCLHCKRNSHYIYDCRTFSNKTTKEKKEFIMQQGLCYGCLDRGHMSNNCHQRRTCGKCKYKHPTSLHGIFKERYEEKKNNKEFKPKLETQAAATLNTSSTNSDTETYTMVLPVYVSSSSDSANEILVYAQLDTQSNTTLILEDVANELKMTVSKPASLQLTTMSSTTLVKCTQYEGLQIRGLHSSTVIPLPTSFGRTEIPGDVTQIPTIETARRYPHLQSIQDKLHKLQDCKIGLLVGCNCSRAIAPINCINTASPCAWETELGWCIVGTNQNASQSTPAQTLKTVVHKQLQPDIDNLSKEIHYSCSLSNKNEFSQIAKLLESDFIESKRDHEKMSQDDIQFLSIITASIHQKASKHYEMKLPFRGESQPEMSNNLLAVLKRLEYLRQRLLKNPQYHEDYTKFMTNIIDQEDAEPVPIEDLHNRLSWYLPHHGVYHPKKPEKIRVVFDCSMTHKGSSLNKALLQGPDMMNNLVGILCRFRKEPIAFIGDIERMYHRFHVTPSDRDYLRFMWYKDGNLDEEPTMYRMKVHLFGAVSSPACANFGLKRIAADHGTKETTKAVEFISDNFYVDDGLYSCQDVTQAIKVLNDARHICNEGNLRLHKIISNNESVLKSIPRSECADHKATQDLSFEEKTDSVDRVLGIQWATETDQFQFKLLLPQKTPTRRGILSTVASIFDPIGWISPFTLTGKIILQDICKHSYQWDDPLQDELLIRWNKWSSELSELSNIKIERCYKPHNFGRVVTYELHHFSDASTCGYGQCSYLRMIDEHGKIHCSLVMSKARVAPRKILTIPRLELMAAVTSVKIGNILKHELKYEMLEEFYWTDSKIVLCYLNNSSKRFHVFVANRVQFIRDHTKPEQWRYISTRSNPADHTSRGLHASELTSSNWMTGPKFLWDILPPPDPVDHLSIPINDPEIRKIIVHKVQIKYLTILKRIEHFSDWKRAVRGVNFLRCCIKHRTNETSTNQVVEVIETERFIIKLCQQEHFADEINLLKHEGASSGKLSAFDPFLDEHGILRIGGRLRMSTSMQYNVKHPILLPKEGHVTHLILKHFHEMAQHQGIGMTIGEIRSNGYYILGVTRLVTSFIFKCVQCRKLRSKTQEQKMADLPLDRLEPSPPFTAVGIDAFGPYFVTERRKELKRYGLIFVCQASRAIHIELLDDMSTDVFINALRCFIAIRGAVAIIRCDCGSNFIGASHELKKAFNEIDCERVKDILLDGHCQFIFNSPSSSHMGGTFERHIRTIRSILNNMLYEHSTRLDTSSLRTLMYEVMSLVNSRPLTYTYLHDKELEPLTPNHLITMKSKIITPPPGKFEASDIYARKRWRKVQQLTNEFWTRWRNEYILNMQQRQKWRKSSRDISIGDIVLLKEEDVYRGSWKMGKVVRIIGSTDHTRRVQLQLGNRQLAKEKTFLERPIHKLVLLVENSD